ncbi:MAG TPA: phosphoribosylanthranilate isomerase [Steroidobacteraceae bacterium]|nr:phosphoribosylanthranilate isomerase [Steroidobacteraceae bacterium]
MASAEEAQLAIRAGADAVGFVGAMPSGPRVIDDSTIAGLAALVPPPIATFLLTSEATAEAIARHVERTHPSTVQIVSYIGASEAAKLAELLPAVRRVQVIHVEDEQVFGLIEGYAPHVHAFLLDSGRPNLAVPEYGGTGRTHDWGISAEFVRRSPRPVFLAGGLTPANVREAVVRVRPFGVDLCSGVRAERRLDSGKLDAFIGAVRQADLDLRDMIRPGSEA